eukprot:762755-Hanusia_phi.AAC.1
MRTNPDDQNLRSAGGTLLDAPDNFLIGKLPTEYVGYWTRAIYQIFQKDSELQGQAETARR